MEEVYKGENPSGLRFKTGEKSCGVCGTKEDIIQFERETERKGLPIVEIAFICEPCAVKENLIEDSKPVVDDYPQSVFERVKLHKKAI